jgi:hypothetical protein
MRFISILIVTVLLFSAGCKGGAEKVADNQQTTPEISMELEKGEPSGAQIFREKLASHCGRAYEGQVIAAPENDDFRGKKLVMHVLSCEGDVINVPFNVGDDRSRTWVFTFMDDRILLKHDHRHEDGTIDEITMYGGMTTNSGHESIQVFPADEETRLLIPEASTNVWWVTLTDSVFTYNLRRLSTERWFSISFDLTKPVEIPQPSWGW